MSRFKIGQRVVAIRSHSQGVYKIGDEFTFDGYDRFPCCGCDTINLIELDYFPGNTCSACNIQLKRRPSWSEVSFAPLEEIHEAISELMKETNLIHN